MSSHGRKSVGFGPPGGRGVLGAGGASKFSAAKGGPVKRGIGGEMGKARPPNTRQSTGAPDAAQNLDELVDNDLCNVLASKQFVNEADFSEALLVASNESTRLDLELGQLVRRFQQLVAENSRTITVLDEHIDALAPLDDDESKEQIQEQDKEKAVGADNE
ncbi:conserved hypothetical protein [Neospora caninum Liverpool]|uniref:Uncharacterized protein n=1 Tax=Neospora caninum (strain Liverpool) TaxID=572307 RepID=F0VIT5_NEOCL|nr:conserved hypothetical protein [Neospora caninum Liverpool]CBZ53646.1 conserved hypothetical protein [Neospora caninum Liverpool]CEL67637.1 TPA: hypothetical protein BN1204_034320 [Neospora caninum Liverpool]|eukprot:XP_003883678.1 conserved hypothetical protein [Neospora caninum Liverpool]